MPVPALALPDARGDVRADDAPAAPDALVRRDAALTLEQAERAELMAARWLNRCEAIDDGGALSAARIASARARHRRAVEAFSDALQAHLEATREQRRVA